MGQAIKLLAAPIVARVGHWSSCDDGCMTRHYLGMKEVAARLGIEEETARGYHKRGLLPEPDVTVGRVRGWDAETIDNWHAARPGRGARTDLQRSTE